MVILGGLLVKQGYNVLFVDMDLYVLLSYYFGIDFEELLYLIYDIFVNFFGLSDDKVLDCLCLSKLDSLFILLLMMVLVILDCLMGNQMGMGLVLKKVLK